MASSATPQIPPKWHLLSLLLVRCSLPYLFFVLCKRFPSIVSIFHTGYTLTGLVQGSQRNVVYLGWPTAQRPRIWAQMRGWVARSQPMNTAALQMKGWLDSSINVWFPFMYSQKWNCAASLFPNRIRMFCLPFLHSYICERLIYFQDRSVCLLCCSQICGPILGIYKLLTDTWM